MFSSLAALNAPPTRSSSTSGVMVVLVGTSNMQRRRFLFLVKKPSRNCSKPSFAEVVKSNPLTGANCVPLRRSAFDRLAFSADHPSSMAMASRAQQLKHGGHVSVQASDRSINLNLSLSTSQPQLLNILKAEGIPGFALVASQTGIQGVFVNFLLDALAACTGDISQLVALGRGLWSVKQ